MVSLIDTEQGLVCLSPSGERDQECYRAPGIELQVGDHVRYCLIRARKPTCCALSPAPVNDAPDHAIYSVGVHRFVGVPRPLDGEQHLFTFIT